MPRGDGLTAEQPIERVVLVGFMGSGKTVVAHALSRVLGWDRVDLDEWIEASTGRSVADLFAERGEAEFRRLETAATEAAADRRRLVVSTGGGWALNPTHWTVLREGSVFVWLRAAERTLRARLSADGVVRPLLAGHKPEARLHEMLEARSPLYEQADLIVDTDHLSPAGVAGEILKQMRECGR